MDPQDHPEILALREQIIKLQRELGAANWRLEEWAAARKEAEVADREQAKEQKRRQRIRTLLVLAYLVAFCLVYSGISAATFNFVSTGKWAPQPDPEAPLALLGAAFVLVIPLAGLCAVATAAGLVWAVGYAAWPAILSITKVFGRGRQNPHQ